MPTNLLVWNIQNFTSRKITPGLSGTEPVYDPQGNRLPDFDVSHGKLNYILTNITFSQADIVVVIETISGQGVKGSLIESAGATGCQSLLTLIRNRTNNANWYLVPPLKLVDRLQVQQMEAEEGADLLEIHRDGAYTEGISVFYNHNQVNFIGPYVWPSSANPNTYPNNDPRKIAVPAGVGVVTENYPAPWNNVLPPGNNFAGQYEFFYQGSEVLFDGTGCRRPFLTKFTEVAPPGRIISLVSVHLPPQGASAGTALTRLAEYFSRARYNIAPNEVILIVGDYNVDYLKKGGTNYLRDIQEQHGIVPLFSRERKPRVNNRDMPSMYRRITGSKPAEWNDYLNPKGLDNLAGRGAFAANTPQYAFLDRVPWPGANRVMYLSLDEIKNITPDVRNLCFRRQQNFGHVGPVPGTSDHIGIVYVV
ncbi:MAG: hypothetical protein JO170_34105 [Verrucomicrobia bacterium]|nr:hypothetical protein [Verrucomicrobiota bacterium]